MTSTPWLRSYAKTLTHPLGIIFQHLLDEEIVPSSWKKSIMKLIFKKGHCFECLNYKSVSLASVCSESLEHKSANHLKTYLNDHGLLSKHQLAFSQGRSMVDQLILVHDNICGTLFRQTGGLTLFRL